MADLKVVMKARKMVVKLVAMKGERMAVLLAKKMAALMVDT